MVITLKKSIIFIIIIGLIVTLLSFFIDIKKEEDKPNNKGIVYSVDNISKNLKKITELNKWDEDIICATSIALLEKDKDGNIIPALVENTEVSEDGIEYKFHIRNDKYWSNGKKINPDDIINFFKELMLQEDTNNILALLDIYGATNYRNGIGNFEEEVAITKEDNIVKIRLNKVNENFLEELTKPQYRIRKNLSKWESIRENYGEIIYSGNYSIEYINDDMLILKGNSEKKQEITFIKDENKELAMAYFEVNDRDIVLNPPKNQLTRLEKEGRLITIPENKGIYMCINDNLDLNQRKMLYKKICEGVSNFQEENPSRIELSEGSYFRYESEDLTKLQNRKVNTNNVDENVNIPKVITLLAEDNEDNRAIGNSLKEFFKNNLSLNLNCSFVKNNEFQDLELQKRYDLIMISSEYDMNNLSEFYKNIIYGFDKEEKEKMKEEIDIASDYEKFEEELFNSYRILPIAFINKNIAISNKISNVFLDGNGNLDLSNIKK